MQAEIRCPSPIYPQAHPSGRGSPFQERLPHDPVRCRPLAAAADIRRAAHAVASAVQRPLAPAVAAPQLVRGSPADATAALPKLPARDPLSPSEGYQLGDILTAIDEGNPETLSAIRDKNFTLFLSGSGVLNPLQYAMNTQNEAMVVVLVGIMSAWVNRLDPATLATPQGRETLNKVRGNLHLAIRFALAHHVHAALASYVQTLVMSQGDAWLQETVRAIATAVAKGPMRDALGHAERAMQRFIVDALKDGGVMEVEDYRLNATTDLLMMGCAQALGDPIGVHCFARDRRVLDELRKRIRQAKCAEISHPQKGILRRCDLVADIMGAGNLGYTGKVELLINHGK